MNTVLCNSRFFLAFYIYIYKKIEGHRGTKPIHTSHILVAPNAID